MKPELEEFADERLAAGKYASRTDALNAALEALRQQERYEAEDAELRRMIAIDMEDIEAGRVVPFDDALVANVKERGRQRDH